MIDEINIHGYFIKKELDMERIVDDYYNYVSTIVKNNSNLNKEDEEEIISDVFFIIWKNREKLDSDLKFSPYIAGITKNVIFRKCKELKRKIEFTEYDESIADIFNVEQTIEDKEINDCIMKNIGDFRKDEQAVFVKFYYENKKIKEISKELGISTSNVKTKLHRIRKKVKKILNLGGF